VNNLSKGERTVLDLLKAKAIGNRLTLHSKDVERNLIPDGKYSLCVSRYMRSLRLKGILEFPDPRSRYHFYIITIRGEE